MCVHVCIYTHTIGAIIKFLEDELFHFNFCEKDNKRYHKCACPQYVTDITIKRLTIMDSYGSVNYD